MLFGTVDGKIIGQLGSVTELEPSKNRVKDELTFEREELTFECEGLTDILRAVMPQGMYNGYVLKRDGYLSPKNGWINENL